MTIHALLFDVGGVLLRTEDLSGRRKWEARFGLGDWELADTVFNNPVSNAAAIGQATEIDAWEWVRRHFDLTAEELTALQQDFWSGDRFDFPLIQWVAEKRGRYRTGILSNAWGGARKFLTSHPPIVAAFEELVISAEEGLRKPDPEIYERALRRLGVSAAEAVFVDDVQENVEAARRVGMTAIHFHPALDVPREMARLGVA
ncbi:MAG: HAD family phosphatase [Chloroflexi bacterium]|nr:HAD family phosphatase [Chloroflexota bacterium]